MISVILFIYIGIQIGAPWWYYTLLGVVSLVKIFGAGAKLGKKAGELSDD